MDKESNFGNIEYKRFIKFNGNTKRKDSLISQLKFRLKEGNGLCTYIIGLDDNGSVSNINESDYDESLKNIKEMCNFVGANISSIKKIYSNSDIYYYSITINDNITNEEYRILNVSNSNIHSNNIELIGYDSNNNLLKSDDNILYDIKKNSKVLIYIKNHQSSQGEINIIKNILTFKPHVIYFEENYEATFKLLGLLKKLKIEYKFSSLIDSIFTIPIHIQNDSKLASHSNITIFQTLFNGNILNNNKIYACITNKDINNFDNLYVYNNGEMNKLIINELQHINQPMSNIGSNKLISISTNLKINGDYHICDSNKCISVKYTNTIPYEVESELTEPEYIGYYKNSVLNVKFNKDHIKLNKNVYLDEKYFIIDIINYYLVINIKT